MNALDESNPNQPGDLVIFDGVCNLCEASVNFIMRHDKDGVFRFVPSQSELGGCLLYTSGAYLEEGEEERRQGDGHGRLLRQPRRPRAGQ